MPDIIPEFHCGMLAFLSVGKMFQN